MQEIIHAFGIDWRLIVIQIFNFAILLAALWYFLYTPILNMLAERQRKIEQGVKDAENAAKALSDADKTKAEVLTGAQSEASQIVSRAKGHAEEKGAIILSEAETKAERLLREAQARGEEIKQQAQKESEADIAKLAILAAEKVLRERA